MSATPDTDVLVVLCTCPDEETAGALAAGLVEERLAACVNILPAIRSIYRWQGETCDDAEALMVIKTTAEAFAAVQDWLIDAHPYDTPEVIALPVAAGSAVYLGWVTGEVSA